MSLFKRKGDRHVKTLSEKIVFIIAFILFVLYAAYILYFFVFAFLCALRPDGFSFDMERATHQNLFSWPKNASFNSFLNSFNELASINSHRDSFLQITWNSIWRTTIYDFLSIATSSCVCYVLVFYRSKLTRSIYNLGIFVSILPLYGSAGATFRLYQQLGFINNPFALITSIGLFGGYFFYMYSFYKTLSWDYAEASFIDGASHYRTFFNIMFPMALPSVAALFVMNFITSWNDYESTILYMSDYPNLAYAVFALDSIGNYTPNYPAYLAGVLVSLLPIIILFLVFQNSIMEKVHLGGLKG